MASSKYGLTREQPHLHWMVWRFAENPAPDVYQEVTALDVIATDESDALAAASTILPLGKKRGKGGYVVRAVTEHQAGQCNHFYSPALCDQQKTLGPII